MSAVYLDGEPLLQGDLPQMTLAQYNALPAAERPVYWERTDADYDSISASDVYMSDGTTSVEDELNKNYTKISEKTATGVFTIDVTNYKEFAIGRANASGIINDYITFHKSFMTICNGVEIAVVGTVVARATLSGNTMSIDLSTLSSGYFYVFAR